MNITNIPRNMFFESGGGALSVPIINTQIRKIIQSGADVTAMLKHFLSKKEPNNIDLTADYFEDRTSLLTNEFYSNKSIASVVIPSTVTNIMSSAFAYSYLTSIIIPDSVTAIASSCFSGCIRLKKADVGTGVASIASSAFSMSGLETLILRRTSGIVALRNTSAFTSCPSTFKVYVPANLVDSYKSATNWVNFADHIEAIVE